MAESAAALRGISDLRGFFRTNRTPIYFISPTAFNLLGVDRWVRSFEYVNYFDSFEGGHPRVVVPALEQHDEFTCIEDVVNYLLRNADLRKLIEKQRVGDGAAGKAVFLFFDQDSERLADEAGLDVMLPSAELRHRLDSKIVTTRLGTEAGGPGG